MSIGKVGERFVCDPANGSPLTLGQGPVLVRGSFVTGSHTKNNLHYRTFLLLSKTEKWFI